MCEVVSYSSLAEEDGSGRCMSITTVLFSDSVRERGPGDVVASLKCRVALQEDDNAALLVGAGVRHMPAVKGDRLLGPRVALVAMAPICCAMRMLTTRLSTRSPVSSTTTTPYSAKPYFLRSAGKRGPFMTSRNARQAEAAAR